MCQETGSNARIARLGAAFFLALTFAVNSPALSQEGRADRQKVFIVSTVDGDTLKLANGEKVRLIGVDTPETVHPSKPVEYFGKEASAFTRRLAEGRRAELEFDWEPRDKYGRILAYVYLEEGVFLNAEIIKQGFGFAYTKFPFKKMDEFRGYEREARASGRGLWGASPPASLGKNDSALKGSGDGPPVKKSRTGICHAQGTRFYIQTKHFVSFTSLDDCLDSGGRLPKGGK